MSVYVLWPLGKPWTIAYLFTTPKPVFINIPLVKVAWVSLCCYYNYPQRTAAKSNKVMLLCKVMLQSYAMTIVGQLGTLELRLNHDLKHRWPLGREKRSRARHKELSAASKASAQRWHAAFAHISLVNQVTWPHHMFCGGEVRRGNQSYCVGRRKNTRIFVTSPNELPQLPSQQSWEIGRMRKPKSVKVICSKACKGQTRIWTQVTVWLFVFDSCRWGSKLYNAMNVCLVTRLSSCAWDSFCFTRGPWPV